MEIFEQEVAAEKLSNFAEYKIIMRTIYKRKILHAQIFFPLKKRIARLQYFRYDKSLKILGGY